MVFSRKQIEFMKNELGVDEDKLMSVTEDEWDELRLSVFDIEVDENERIMFYDIGFENEDGNAVYAENLSTQIDFTLKSVQIYKIFITY